MSSWGFILAFLEECVCVLPLTSPLAFLSLLQVPLTCQHVGVLGFGTAKRELRQQIREPVAWPICPRLTVVLPSLSLSFLNYTRGSLDEMSLEVCASPPRVQPAPWACHSCLARPASLHLTLYTQASSHPVLISHSPALGPMHEKTPGLRASQSLHVSLRLLFLVLHP